MQKNLAKVLTEINNFFQDRHWSINKPEVPADVNLFKSKQNGNGVLSDVLHVSGVAIDLSVHSKHSGPQEASIRIKTLPNILPMEEKPFRHLKIDSYSFLRDVEGRTKCTKCNKPRKYFCYTCCLPVSTIADKVPKVTLPIKVDIIKHPNEVDGKSTALHAATLAPDDVRVFTYPCLPIYKDSSKVVMVFPGKDALTLEDHLKQYGAELPDSVDHIGTQSVIDKNSTKSGARDPDVCDSKTIGDREEAIHVEKSDILKSQSGEVNIEMKSGTSSPRNDSEHVKNLNSVCAVNVQQKQDNVSAEEKDSKTENKTEITKMSQKRASSVNNDEIPPAKMSKNVVCKYSCDVERVVFIDSTWNQVHRIAKDERLKGIRKIELKSQTTKFWRHQADKPRTYLATIEAIYYFLVEYHELCVQEKYCGQYDNILFLYAFMYDKIMELYDGGESLKAYQFNL